MRQAWWAGPLAVGVVCGALLFAVGTARADIGPGQALVAAVIGGLLCGAASLWSRRRELRAVAADTGTATPEDLHRAEAVLRGEMPRDERDRELAVRLAAHRAGASRRQAVGGVLGLLVLAGMLVALALQQSPWWWAGVGLAAAAAGDVVRSARAVRRRAEELRAPVR